MDIKNKTARPIRVPLAGGKRCFLGPGGVGQISPKAAEEPAVKKLIEDGTIEVQGAGPAKWRKSGGSASGVRSNGGGPSSGGIRHHGD